MTGESSSELAQLRAELAELRAEVAALRSAPAAADSAKRADEPEDVASRRGFLRLAGTAAAGAAGAAVVGLAATSAPAAATTGQPLLLGVNNTTSSVADSTQVYGPSTSVLQPCTFRANNYSNTQIPLPADHRIGLAGTASGVDAATSTRTGVYGRTASPGGLGGQGVFGSAGDGPDNPFASGLHFGVAGTAPDGGYGMFAYAPVGVSAIGILARADQGFGVVASSFTGISLYVRDGGRILQDLRTESGPPTTGAFSKGEMIRDQAGDMYLCTAGGTPGTWRKVVSQDPGQPAPSGTIVLLPRPIRLVDTRTAAAPINNGTAKLTPNVPLTAQITGTVSDSLSVPTGARGILGNITITSANGNGYALVWAADQPTPQTSNINYGPANSNPAIANYFISAIDGAGQLKVMCAEAATHVIVDVFGYTF